MCVSTFPKHSVFVALIKSRPMFSVRVINTCYLLIAKLSKWNRKSKTVDNEICIVLRTKRQERDERKAKSLRPRQTGPTKRGPRKSPIFEVSKWEGLFAISPSPKASGTNDCKSQNFFYLCVQARRSWNRPVNEIRSIVSFSFWESAPFIQIFRN